MIVKNEEANLPACLGSVEGLVQEIIIVDTGSTDRTKELAVRLGARVFDFAWVNDFAAARNASLAPATGDWIFWLDGDERLDEANRARLRQLFANLPRANAAYVMQQRSVSDPATGEASIFGQVRLFPNRPHLRWRYRVHEQILPALEEAGAEIGWTDVTIEHAGYEEPALYRRKQERNLRLLGLQYAEGPDDPLTLFNLGLTHWTLGQPAEAMDFWRQSLERSPPTLSLVRKLYSLLAKGHIQLGRPRDALAMVQTGRGYYPDDIELLALEAGLLGERGDLAGAEACLRRILETPNTLYFAASLDVGLRGYKTRYNLGRICRAQGRDPEAEELWRAAVAEQPAFAPAWLDLGNLYLEQQHWEALAEVAKRLEAAGQFPAAVQLRVHGDLARGDAAAARASLEEALPRFPNLDLRVLHSRVLLREGKDGDAAESALREVLALDPYHIEARNNLSVLLRQRGRPGNPIPRELADELFRRAEKAFESGSHGDAAAIYRPLLHAGYLPGLVHYRLAMIANHRGDFAAAWELHLQALALDPGLAAKVTPPERLHHGVVCRLVYDTVPVECCPVCGSRTFTPMMVINCLPFNHYHPSIHPVRRWVRCAGCGHGFANPRPGPGALRQAYQDPPPDYLTAWGYERLALAADVVHALWQRRPGGDWLDVGVGSGAMAGLALDYGYRVCGIDVHPAYAEHVHRLGVNFLLGDVSAYDFGVRRFDVITLGDVLEHLPDPAAAMSRLGAVLKPQGLVWVSTPNHEGVWTRARREKDPMWMEGEHLHMFSRASLTRMLGDRALSVVDYRLSKRFAGCMEVTAVHP
jgi:tetratricopeptide (TPR) repeat protein/SAM-dependent methyltransferase